MQTVLEQGSIDKPLSFDVGLIQLSFSYQSVHLIHATFQSNCAEGLHFSAFHSVCPSFLLPRFLPLRATRRPINDANGFSATLALLKK